jgi:hypothetical protein
MSWQPTANIWETRRRRTQADRPKSKKPQPDGWGTVPYESKPTTLASPLSSKILINNKYFKSAELKEKEEKT